MSKSVKYLLVSLPTSISASDDNDEAFAALSTTVPKDYGTVCRFHIPEFKIGTLDALVQQADELAKLGSSCEGVVSKVADSLGNILDGDESKISQQKTVKDRPVDNYIKNFSWNNAKYRTDRALAELIDNLQKECTRQRRLDMPQKPSEIVSIDGDVKSKQTQYTQVRTSLIALQRKQTFVARSHLPVLQSLLASGTMTDVAAIVDSEYIETLLVAVPNPLSKEFLKSYETLAPMVVPRSATNITSDQEYTLFAVTIFKKHSQEFVHKCRERKWTPREYKYVEGGMEAEQKEVNRVTQDQQKLWGEALRLFRTAWGESIMIWMHVLALRVFVETVLRYGLPLKFVCGVITSTPKLAKKAKFSLDSTYSYLGGNAFGRDKKGRIKTKDDSSLSSDMAAMGIGGVHGGEDGEYTAYVYYEFEIS